MLEATGLERLEVLVPVEVKPYDIDVVGIVSNIVYVRWMEDLRLAMLAAYLPLQEQMDNGIVPAIRRTEVDYRRPIVMHEQVTGQMWLSGLTKVRFEVTANFLVGDEVAASARQVGCFINLTTKRPARVPESLMTRFKSLNS